MILLNDFKAEPKELQRCEMLAIERVLRSGNYVLGAEVKSFETIWARRCGTAQAVGLGNGMDAIEVGLRSLDIGQGDEVITTSMTAFATVLAIFRAGAVPVLADIDPGTAMLSIESVERCISKRTKAVLLVHLYGQIGNMAHWDEFCQKHKLELLEDCAQAHMAKWGGQVAGSFGRFGAYSFYPTKNLGTFGDAGALVTNDIKLSDRAKRLRNYGQSQRYHHPEIGLNSRLDELHAAVLLERLNWLDKFLRTRRKIANRYYREIVNPRIRLLLKPKYSESHVYHLFVVLCKKRDQLSKYLTAAGISNLSHYPVPVHQQAPCRATKMDPKGMYATEQHAHHCLSIPCHPQMTDEHAGKVIELLNAF